MLSLIERWLKKAALEVQEYVRLVTATFAGVFTRPFYRHDVIEQFDLIGCRVADGGAPGGVVHRHGAGARKVA